MSLDMHDDMISNISSDYINIIIHFTVNLLSLLFVGMSLQFIKPYINGLNIMCNSSLDISVKKHVINE